MKVRPEKKPMRVRCPPTAWLFSRRIPPHLERQPVPAGASPATDAPLERRRDDARAALPNGRRPRPPADLENGAGGRPNPKEQAMIKSIVAALDFATYWTGRAV